MGRFPQSNLTCGNRRMEVARRQVAWVPKRGGIRVTLGQGSRPDCIPVVPLAVPSQPVGGGWRSAIGRVSSRNLILSRKFTLSGQAAAPAERERSRSER